MAHDHGQEFPREETRELVGEALRSERRRAWIQDPAVALGLSLLALGLPTERLLPAESLFPSERAGFLASAVSFALGWLVLMRAARRNGWESGPALRASFAAALLPPVLVAATTPGPAAIGWLGGCCAVALLTVEVSSALRVLSWAVTAGLLGLALLAWPPGVWLAPLGWLGVLELEKRGRRTAWILMLAFASGAAGSAWTRLTDPERHWRPLAEELLQPSDLVLTGSPAHRRLLLQRYGVEALLLASGAREQLAARVEAARSAGRRVVLDADALEGLDEDVRRWAEVAGSTRLSTR